MTEIRSSKQSGSASSSPSTSRSKSTFCKNASKSPRKKTATTAEALMNALKYLPENSLPDTAGILKSSMKQSFNNPRPANNVQFGRPNQWPPVGTAVKADGEKPGTEGRSRRSSPAKEHPIGKRTLPTPPTTPKRPADLHLEKSGSPKRSQASSRRSPTTTKPTNSPRKPHASQQSSELISELSSVSRQPMTFIDLAKDIQEYPRALYLDEIAHLFHLLQNELRVFCHKFFAFGLSTADTDAWPLEELAIKYEPLMRVTQYIADGSLHTWRGFFTAPESRPWLVYGIVGEWFKHHIFGATAFGLSFAEQNELEDVDRTYIYYDGFVRTKARGKKMQNILDNKCELGKGKNMRDALDSLVDDILEVIDPLLPTFRLAKSDNPMAESSAKHKMAQLTSELYGLAHLAAKMHWCIRLTGQESHIIRICPSILKGEKFNPWAPQNCINKKHCNETKDSPVSDVLKIKMTCFGRVEATSAIGPDRIELENEHERLLAEMEARGEQYVADEGDQQHTANEKEDATEGCNSVPGQQDALKTQLPSVILPADSTIYPDLPDELQDADDDSSVVPEIKRGAYVTITQLCPADVWCEWSPKPQNPNAKDTKHLLSLHEAIIEARKESSILRLQTAHRLRQLWGIGLPVAQWALAIYILTQIHRGADLAGLLSKVPNEVSELVQRLQRSIDTPSLSSLVGNITSHLPTPSLPEVDIHNMTGSLENITSSIEGLLPTQLADAASELPHQISKKLSPYSSLYNMLKSHLGLDTLATSTSTTLNILASPTSTISIPSSLTSSATETATPTPPPWTLIEEVKKIFSILPKPHSARGSISSSIPSATTSADGTWGVGFSTIPVTAGIITTRKPTAMSMGTKKVAHWPLR